MRDHCVMAYKYVSHRAEFYSTIDQRWPRRQTYIDWVINFLTHLALVAVEYFYNVRCYSLTVDNAIDERCCIVDFVGKA
jgi:hypothetical protein